MDTTLGLLALIRAHKKAVNDADATALKMQSDAYRGVVDTIQQALKRLFDQRAAAEENGEEVGLAWLYQRDRMIALLSQAESEINRYAAQLAPAISGYQSAAATMAESHAREAVVAQLADATNPYLVPAWNSLPIGAIDNLLGALADGTPLQKRLAQLAPDTVPQIKAAIVQGVAVGKGAKSIAKDVSDAANIARDQALRLVRTEGLRAYREASRESYQANDNVVDNWTWLATLSSRTCVACIAMNGTIHPIDEPMASHICCRCVQVPNTKSWADILGPEDAEGLEDTRPVIETGESWFRRQDVAKQDAILGKDAGAAYRAGKVTLPDFVGVKKSDTWGDSIYVRSLKSAMKAAVDPSD